MANGRCRMHGGNSRGPIGQQNNLKHGFYTAAAIAERKAIKEFLGHVNATLAEIPVD